MTLTDEQLETVNNISPTGLHLNEGTPCECGAESYSTKKKRAFSDSMVYKHTCGQCKNKFSTWSEG